MEKGIIEHSRICVFLTKCDLFAFFFFSNFWFKQVREADNHGNPEKCGCRSVCGELKKCVEGFIYLFTNVSYWWLFDPKQGQKFLENGEL